MILNRNLVYDLTFGDSLRSPEAGDNNVQVPNMVLPVVLALRPHTVINASNQLFEGSGFTQAALTRTNQASTTNNVLTLIPGLWEIEVILSSWFNYNKIGGDFNATTITILYQGFTIPILERYAALNVSSTDYGRLRLLLTSQAIMTLTAPITGVGQSVDTKVFINAIRIL